MKTVSPRAFIFCCVLILLAGMILPLALPQQSEAASYAWINTGGGVSSSSIASLCKNGTLIYAGTTNSTVWQYDTASKSWSQLGGTIGTSNTIKSLTMYKSVLYAGTSAQGLWRYSSGSWSNVSGTTSSYSINALASDSNYLYAGTTSHGVYRYSGSSWTQLRGLLSSFNDTVNSLALNGSTLYAGTATRGVYTYNGSLSGWGSVGSGISSYAVNALSWISGILYAGTASHGIWKLNGNTWSNISAAGLSSYTVNALAADTANIYVGTASHGVWRYTISGGAWLDTGGSITANTVQALAMDSSVPYAGTAGQGVWKYDLAALTPSIIGISPSSGAVGTTVTISGNNFGTSGSVTFGTTAATVSSWTDTTIVCQVPNVGAGLVAVTVTAPGGSATSTFTVTAPSVPAINSINPPSGDVGATVVIAGSNFGSSQGSSTVKFASTPATVSNWSDTSITCTVPNVGPGQVPVSVNTSAGTGTGTFTVTVPVPKPSISSIQPNQGPVGTAVTIGGTGFGSGGTLSIAGTPVNTTSWAETEIKFAVPDGLSTGAKDIKVTTDGGTDTTSFTVTESTGAPVISYILPGEGQVGTTVSIVGLGFGDPKAGSVTIGGTAVTASSWSDVLIRFTVPSGLSLGTNAVVVNTPGGSESTSFNVTAPLPAPVINSLTPNSGPVRSSVTIDGSNFGTWQEGCCVYLGTTEITLPAWSEDQITFIVPDGASGTLDVTVKTLSGISNALPFTVTETPPAPILNSITPASAAVGAEVTIAGSNFGADQGDSKVTLLWWFLPTDLAPGDYVSWTDTQIKFKVPDLNPATYSVSVTVGGQQSGSLQFDIIEVPAAPVIDSISPPSGPAGTSIAIIGSGFGSSQGTSTLKFGSTDVTPTSWSNSQITCQVPDMAIGPVEVSVTNSISTAKASFTITEAVPVPAITSVSPDSGIAGTTVTVNGSNFGATRDDSKVSLIWFLWFGTDVTDTDYVSWTASQIQFKVPSGIGEGSYSLMVTVGGQQSNSMAFEVIPVVLPVPQISTISPTSGNPGTSVTITGTGFGADQGASKVTFGTVDAVTYTSWTDTQVVCKAPWQPSGAVQVKVTTDGGGSNAMTFTMTTPPPGQVTLASITPNQGTTLDFSLSVDVKGTGFVDGATLKLTNGATTLDASNVVVVSSTEITADFGFFMAPSGPYSLTVINPDNGQATLNDAFTVTDACGTGSGVTMLGFGLMMGLLSLSGTGVFRRRMRRKNNA